MITDDYNATVEVATPTGEIETTTYEVKNVNTKAEARRRLKKHFGDALEEVKRIFKRGGNGGAGGAVAI